MLGYNTPLSQFDHPADTLAMNNLSRIRVELKFSKNIAREHRFNEALFASAGLLDLADAWAEDFDFVQTIKYRCRNVLALSLRAQTKPFFGLFRILIRGFVSHRK
jgi:hypothetical protein